MKYVYGTCTPYTIRNIIRRWNKTRAISMGHNSLSSCDIILVIDYIKMNCRCSKINYIELRLINNKNGAVDEFSGNEREANAFLSEMYSKYNIEPCQYENDYWNDIMNM